MEKVKKSVIALSLIFIFAEIFLGVSIQLISADIRKILCFLSVLISFLFSLFLLYCKRDKEALVSTAALLFTVISDIFLVLLSPQLREVAMISFSLAQICYFARLMITADSVQEKRVHIAVRLSLIALIMTACVIALGDGCDFLALISTFYFANLLSNLIFSAKQIRRSPLLPVGLLFFALCDLFVGLSVMAELYFTVEEGTFVYSLIHTRLDMVWLFYVPSQTLIPLSLIIKKQG